MKDALFDVLQTTGMGTVLFIMLFLFKRLILKYCGVRFWHIALMANAVVFVLPSYPLKFALAPVVQPLRQIVKDAMASRVLYGYNTVNAMPPSVETLIKRIAIIWFIGVAVCLASLLIRYVFFILKSRKKQHLAPAFLTEIYAMRIFRDNLLNKRRRLEDVKILSDSETASPMSYGFFKKRISLPTKMIEDLDESEIVLILRHESAHIRNKDAWKLLFLAAVRAFNWFNPFVFILLRCVVESMELYCDEIAVSNLSDINGDVCLEYGELLLGTAFRQRRLRLSELVMRGSGFIKQRVKQISTVSRKPSKLLISLFAFLSCLILFTYLTGFSIFDQRLERTFPTGYLDTGEVSNDHDLQVMDAKEWDAFSITDNGAYDFEGYLHPDSVNYAPACFTTNSTKISLTLLSGESPVLVYIYYSSDLDYPLMLLSLEKKGVQYSFTMLSGSHVYSLGFIVDHDNVSSVKIQIAD